MTITNQRRMRILSIPMSIHRLLITIILGGLLFGAPALVAYAAPDQSEVRAAVQRVFDQLKAHDYGSLYDVLPASQRARMSRDRFVNALQRAQDIYELDRMEIGAVRVDGNLAVVDTVLYGRVVNPVQAEGKIVVQQYLVREDGKWRVATGDQGTVRKFLASSPGFKKGFRLTQPKIYIKQNGKWLEFNPMRRRSRR